MSSPQSTTNDASKNLEQITFRFCSECSNMLYPKEDEDSHKLQFTCRTCQYTEEATSTCVFRNIMNNAVGETAGVTQDVGSDPTVRTHAPCLDTPTLVASPQVSPAGHLSGEYTSEDTAACAHCGRLLPKCSSCGRVVSTDKPYDFMPFCSDLGFEDTIHAVTVASVYGCLDLEHQATWDETFIANILLDKPWDSDADITSYLGDFMTLDADADPPEALDIEPDFGDLELMF